MCMHSEAKEFNSHWELLHVSKRVRAACQAESGSQEPVQLLQHILQQGCWASTQQIPLSCQQQGRWQWKHKGWLSILAGQDFTQHLITFIYNKITFPAVNIAF